MKKRVLAIIVLILLIFSSSGYAESENSIYWDKAVVHLDMYNNKLFSLMLPESVAKRQYENSVEDAKAIDPVGVSIDIMGKEKYIRFDEYTQMLLTQQKEFSPEQMKFSWEMARSNRAVTRNAMIIGLRSLYLGLYSADRRSELEQMKAESAERIFNQENLRYQRGLISELELAEADYEFIKAKKDYEASKRTTENMLRSYNTYIGIDPDTAYDEINYDEEYSEARLKKPDYYLNKALTIRLDITGAEKQLSLLEKRKAIIDRFPSSLGMMHVRQEYDNLVSDIESQKLQIESTKLEVEKEIKSAYVEVTAAGKNVVHLKKVLELQRTNLEKAKERYRVGLISKNIQDQAQISFIELENNYQSVLFDYNTKLMKLECAAGVGPAY